MNVEEFLDSETPPPVLAVVLSEVEELKKDVKFLMNQLSRQASEIASLEAHNRDMQRVINQTWGVAGDSYQTENPKKGSLTLSQHMDRRVRGISDRR